MAAPDVDDRVFRMQWWLPLLVLSLFVLPPIIGSVWLGDATVRVNGVTHLMTRSEKVGATSVALAWLGVLLFARYRHQRRLRTALAATLIEPPPRRPGQHRVEIPEPEDHPPSARPR